MIIDGILALFKLILSGIVALIPDLGGFTIPSGFIEWFQNIVNMSAYFLPLADFFLMFGIWMLVTNFQIVWKIIQRVWDALPFT